MPEPLTTLFQPPESCSDQLYTQSTSYFGKTWYRQDNDGPTNGANSECYPPKFWSMWNELGHPPTYSPGVCPSGWIAYAPTGQDSGVGQGTISVCCPSYAPTYGARLGCQRTLSTSTSVILTDPTRTVAVNTDLVEVAWPVWVHWASVDLTLFSPASAPLSSVATTATPPPITTSIPSTSLPRSSTPRATSVQPAKSDQKSSSTLGTGDEAGIGVGVGLFVVAAIALAIWLFLHRFRKRRKGQAAKHYDDQHQDRAQWDVNAWSKISAPKEYRSELYGTDNVRNISEMDNSRKKPETFELPGS